MPRVQAVGAGHLPFPQPIRTKTYLRFCLLVSTRRVVGWVTLAGTLTSPHVKHKRSRPNTPVPNSEPFATHHNSCRSPGSLLPSPLASAPNTSRLVSWQEPLATKHRNSSTITRVDILACLATRTLTHTQCHRVVAQPKES